MTRHRDQIAHVQRTGLNAGRKVAGKGCVTCGAMPAFWVNGLDDVCEICGKRLPQDTIEDLGLPPTANECQGHGMKGGCA